MTPSNVVEMLYTYNCMCTYILMCLRQNMYAFILHVIFIFYRNLQAAVCSYFDFEAPNHLPSMVLVKDITVGDGESVPPKTRYVKHKQQE
jgi:hypothetical protein